MEPELDENASVQTIGEDEEMTAGGLHRFHEVVQISKTTAKHSGMQRNVMATRFEAAKDLITFPGARGQEYVHGGADGIHAKLGIATTAPLEDKALFTRYNFEELSVNEFDLSNYSAAYYRLWARGPH